MAVLTCGGTSIVPSRGVVMARWARWDIGALSHPLPRYVVAAGVVLVAWVVTALSWDWTRPAVALFSAAVMIAAWNGGFGPGLLASVLAALLSESLISDSFHT